MLGPSLGTGSFQKLNSRRSWFLRDRSIFPRSFLYAVNSCRSTDIKPISLSWHYGSVVGMESRRNMMLEESLPCSVWACSSPLLGQGSLLCNATGELWENSAMKVRKVLIEFIRIMIQINHVKGNWTHFPVFPKTFHLSSKRFLQF